MSSILVFSPCCKVKDDTVPIQQGARVVAPEDYLEDKELLHHLKDTRRHVLYELRVVRGDRDTYAFDLYVRTGKAYKGVFPEHYEELKQGLLFGHDIQWFFLSGGYGAIHALETARCYNANFIRVGKKDKKVLYTAKIWRECGRLSEICDAIVERAKPSRVYVFGSRAYTDFIEQAVFWQNKNQHNIHVQIFQSEGSAGTAWLSPILGELAKAIICNSFDSFDTQYQDQFVPQ